jgi:superfamily I DNA and RNA helicase
VSSILRVADVVRADPLYRAYIFNEIQWNNQQIIYAKQGLPTYPVASDFTRACLVSYLSLFYTPGGVSLQFDRAVPVPVPET